MIPEFLENLKRFEEALKADTTEQPCDFDRVENSLFQKIRGAETDGALSLLRLDEIPPDAVMERVENGLAQRIDQYIEYEAPVDECIKDARGVHSRYWRFIERKLDAKLASIRSMPLWEQLLLRDEIALLSLYERAENALFSKIDAYEAARAKVRRSVVAYFAALARFAPLKAVGAAAAACLFMAGGYFVYREQVKPIPIALYLAQGNRLDLFKTPLPRQGTIASEKGGSVTFVTNKGYVELQNGSQVNIIRSSEKNVCYRAHFADADNQLIGQGSATFFVNHQKSGQRYSVATRDYRVEVRGTYFRLQPDIGGHVSIAVREGVVTVVFNNGETRSLKAGQLLAYDLNSNTYATTSDGVVVTRQEIDQLPDIKDLNHYERLSITTTPAASVRIDGRFVGMSPLIIMQPKGVHGISVERNGFQTLDTSVVIAAPAVAVSLTLKELPRGPSLDPNILVYDEVSVVNERKTRDRHNPSIVPSSSQRMAEEAPYDENDFPAAERLEAAHWQKALALYAEIADNPQAPRLKREAALFSIGKLKAEHGNDKAAAREAFLNYLALYPAGNFVGESWLRLAELEFSHDQDKAIEYYLRYFEHYPRHLRISELQHRVGLIYLQKKKYGEAIAMFKLALANYQSDNTIDKGKIQTSLYRAMKERDDSISALPAKASPVPEKTKTK
jgi:hypothetical protein